jgi:outer membrane protein
LIFKANGKQGAENFQEKHLYYPIPTSELNNNTAMEQTSLWK